MTAESGSSRHRTDRIPRGRRFAAAGAIFAGLGVAAGAFGAHALRAHLDAGQLATFDTAVRYQMWHALALFAVAWLSDRHPSGRVTAAGLLLIAGILLFSGSLYALVLSGTRALGVITPVGGSCWLVAWLLLAWSCLSAGESAGPASPPA